MTQSDVEELYRRYGSLVLRRARVILSDEASAEDAMHEVFARVITKGDQFRGESSMSTWLYKITTNYCLTRIRDNKRQRGLIEANPDALTPGGEESAETRMALQQALEAVPEEFREVAVYHYIDGMNHQAIADLLGVSRRTVGYRLKRFAEEARTLLGEPLTAEQGDEPMEDIDEASA